MPKLFVNMSAEQANLCALVLSSSGIPYYTTEGSHGWEVWVKDVDVEAALAAIKRYFRENPGQDLEETAVADQPVKTASGLWAAGLLGVVYWAISTNRAGTLFFDNFAASAERILAGEYYRTLTALMLHADMLHLAGNMIGLALFGTAVCSIVRPGPGWLMILLSGIIGNLGNALLYRSGHISVGASTAVFGAVGILCACQFWYKIRGAGQRARAWLPIAGGLAFLAILGTGGRRVDLMAHLLGFVAGIALGLAYCRWLPPPASKRRRLYSWVLTAGLLAAGWLRLF